MITILCFGDSNTWGYDAASGGRHPYDVRWPGQLQRLLGGKARVIEEGLNGRTTVFNEPFRRGRNGSKFLATLMESHAPLDLLIIALGANDLKPIYHASGYDSALGIQRLIAIAKQSPAWSDISKPEILLLLPTRFGNLNSNTAERFAGSTEKFSLFLSEYSRVARESGIHLLDSNEHIVTSREDGVHLDAENHGRLAAAVSEKVSKIVHEKSSQPWLNRGVME